MELLDGLDPAQRATVTSDAAPLAILAGAGSGKTRVLTRRIAWLSQERRIDPSHVLALTFTRKAAGELVARLSRLGVRSHVTAGTFHSIALAQLRRRQEDRRRSMPEILSRKARILVPLMGERGAAATVAASEVASEIEWAKARRIAPEQYAEAVLRAERETPRPPETIAKLYARYETEKRSRGLIDFDDLIWWCSDALRDDTEFAATQRWRFRHLFVDEFQDSTPSQVALLRGWLGDATDLTVVGDPDQAIFGFAGANPFFLADFARHFPGGTTVTLDTNYRSTPQVVAAARAVLSAKRADVAVLTPRDDGSAPTITVHDSDDAEARAVATAIRRARRLEEPWSAHAILYRTNAQSALFEEALAAQGIPFRVRGGQQFLARPEVKANLDELRKVTKAAPHRDLLSHLRDLTHDETMGTERLEHARALARLGEEYVAAEGGPGTLDGFLVYLSVALRGDDGDHSGDGVELLTFHRAKGLEFTRVWVTGFERGLVPISFARSAAERAEEHRLAYVAMSRAHDELSLSWAHERNGRSRAPSPWLDAIEAAINGTPLPDRSATGDSVAAARDELRRSRRATPVELGEDDLALFEELKAWRLAQSRAAKVPAYVVFDDRTLAAVARERPTSTAALLTLPGIGPVKADRYGAALIDLVQAEAASGGTAGGVEASAPVSESH